MPTPARPMASMDEGYTLSIAGDAEEDAGGLDITGRSSLRDVREKFPVPAEFFFGVPVAREAVLLARDFMPITLLNGSEVPKAVLKPHPSDAARLKRELHALGDEVAEERENKEAAEAARDTATRERMALAAELDAAKATIAQLRACDTGREREHADSRRRLSAAPSELRDELTTLRALAMQARAETAAALTSLGRDLNAQITSRMRAEQDASTTIDAEQMRHSSELEQLRLRAAAANDGLAAAAESAKDKDATIQALTGRVGSLEGELQQMHSRLAAMSALANAPPPAPPPAPPNLRQSSAFADYMRTSTLKRDMEAVLSAGNDLHRTPSSSDACEALGAAIGRLSASSASLIDSSSGGGGPWCRCAAPLHAGGVSCLLESASSTTSPSRRCAAPIHAGPTCPAPAALAAMAIAPAPAHGPADGLGGMRVPFGGIDPRMAVIAGMGRSKSHATLSRLPARGGGGMGGGGIGLGGGVGGGIGGGIGGISSPGGSPGGSPSGKSIGGGGSPLPHLAAASGSGSLGRMMTPPRFPRGF